MIYWKIIYFNAVSNWTRLLNFTQKFSLKYFNRRTMENHQCKYAFSSQNVLSESSNWKSKFVCSKNCSYFSISKRYISAPFELKIWCKIELEFSSQNSRQFRKRLFSLETELEAFGRKTILFSLALCMLGGIFFSHFISGIFHDLWIMEWKVAVWLLQVLFILFINK